NSRCSNSQYSAPPAFQPDGVPFASSRANCALRGALSYWHRLVEFLGLAGRREGVAVPVDSVAAAPRFGAMKRRGFSAATVRPFYPLTRIKKA
ncbi:hypothetical protein, partial [Enterobacter asburiae]|uniref:hypothetical protein n=1 Tax=Enterobacter asburiae TaxID=61645 RepID=UPI001E4CCF52